ncbi:autotransporter outer membrane beta-barrel domain-containing protein [uncultured Phascolarctobacterium sp.]|uniref:autotransporter family protein n=1 Tax=uncultured Phascolarctobacterium sp. TaxID=512296 RepID=UPI0025E94AC4|nr:autotransporter outer membrane beta-barrel domain-containing protein [uncultured Phascolarctobacterium sp.]
MKRKKYVIKKAALASVLAMSLNNVVWAAEGVNSPFTTVGALEGVGGTASITSSNVNHVVKGIYSSSQDFIYNSGNIKLDIDGFASTTTVEHDSIGIFSYNGTVDLKQLEMNFVDTSGTVHNTDVYGVKTYASGVVKIGDGSKITVSGNVSNIDPDDPYYIMKGLYAGDNATMDSGIITVGDDFELTVHNYGDGWTYGIDFYDGATISVGDGMKLFVTGGKDARGVEVGFHEAKVTLGESASITANSRDGVALGVFVFNTGKFEAAKDATIIASTDNAASWAAGVLAQGTGSEAVLNGATISATEDGAASYAIYAYNNGSVVGNAGKYNIYGNILNSGGTVDLTANDGSFIEGWVNTASNAETNISLEDASYWKVTGDSNLTHLHNDNSIVDMTNDGNTFSTLTVEHLSGNNGVIKMDIDASQNTVNSDKLYITDSLTGTQYIDLYEVNSYTPVGVEGVGTVLATVNNNNGTLVAKDGEGTLYWKRYELDHQDTADLSGDYTKDWYLKQVLDIEGPTTSTDTILSANALNYHTWRTENDKLMQRMGELRHNGAAEQGAWFRVKGTKIGRDGKFNFENKYTTYELGYDRLTKQTEKMKRYQGVALSYTDGTSSYNRGTGDNSSKSINFYTTQMGSKGHYLDVVFKVSNMDNDFSVYDTNSNKITGDANNTGVSLSAEYGRKNDLKHGWYIEPQAQFTLGYLGGDNYFTSNGIEVSQSGIKSAVGRIGFNIGKEVGSRGIVYAKANLLHEFGGGYDVTMSDSSGQLKTSDTFNDTWFEYGVGAAVATGKNSHIYLDVERSAGSDFTKDWQWNVGARWTF